MKRMLIPIIIILGLIIIYGCGPDMDTVKKLTNGNNSQYKYKANLYFTDKDNSKILSEIREISYEDEEDLPELVIKELLKGPVNLEMKRAISDKAKLLNISQNGSVTEVNFSEEYHDNDDIGELVTRFSIVNTLCDLPNIQKVKIFVEGKELVGPSGNSFGAMGKNDIVFDQSLTGKGYTSIKLYFQDTESTMLLPESRRITVKDNELIEKCIIQELIKGPERKELSKTIPQETKLLSIETKDEVCFVNVSQEFKTKHSGGSWGELMTIYSIVNSLTELPHITQVQFLIEGKTIEDYKGHVTFNEPFKRDEGLFKKNSNK